MIRRCVRCSRLGLMATAEDGGVEQALLVKNKIRAQLVLLYVARYDSKGRIGCPYPPLTPCFYLSLFFAQIHHTVLLET